MRITVLAARSSEWRQLSPRDWTKLVNTYRWLLHQRANTEQKAWELANNNPSSRTARSSQSSSSLTDNMSQVSTGPEDLQWRRSNWTAYGYCLVVALGAILFGFDQAAISGIIAIKRFQEDFGLEVDPATDTWAITAGNQTLLYAMLLVGAWVASIVSGPLGTTFGRKAGLYCCAVASLIGPVIQIVAPNMGVEAFGRVISGMGIGFASNFCGTYWSEITPAKYRGMVLSVTLALSAEIFFADACSSVCCTRDS